MPVIEIGDVGSIGIVADIPPHELPPEAWTSGRNVRMHNGSVEKFTGDSAIFGTPGTAPHWILPVNGPNEFYYIYAGLVTVHDTDGTTHTDISKVGDYSASADINWNGGVFNGIPILNNGVDDPQMQTPVTRTTQLADLSNWPANTKAKVIRPFGSFLVALDITKAATEFRFMVKWSHPAGPGAVPTSWDETDPTKRAGEVILAEEGGFVVDCLPLGGTNFIYKEGSTYAQRFIGGNFVFDFGQGPRFSDDGILTRNCVQAFLRQHFVVTRGDIKIHNGVTITSIIDKRRRDEIFNNIDESNAERCFTFSNYQRNEIWFCYPETGSAFATRAAVWNWVDNVWGLRDLVGVQFITSGLLGDTLPVINNVTTIINETDTLIDEAGLNVARDKVIIADTTNTKLLQGDVTNQFQGANMTSFIERTGLGIVGRDRRGRWKVDTSVVKNAKAVYPRITADPGTTISIQLGFQRNPDGPVTYAPAQVFDPAVDEKVTFLDVTGPLLAIKFQSTGNVDWRLQGYGIEIELAGKV